MNKFMEVALNEARIAAKEGEVPVGAAIFMGENLISSAHNMIEQLYDPMAHAEILAIKKAVSMIDVKSLSECSLYVTLEPCPMCAGAIHLCKLKRIYFGAYDIKSGACGGCVDLRNSGCFDYKTEIYGGIDEPLCEKILKDFFIEIRKEDKISAK